MPHCILAVTGLRDEAVFYDLVIGWLNHYSDCGWVGDVLLRGGVYPIKVDIDRLTASWGTYHLVFLRLLALQSIPLFHI